MLAIIVARSKNNVIGKDGCIPWRIKGEQKQFKELTTNNVVIMGRKTYEDIGHPLPNRLNIVISSTVNYEGENLITVKSLQEALEYADGKDIYVAGGFGVFKEAIPYVDKMYITEVDMEVENGTTFFPEFNEDEFDKEEGEILGDEIKFQRVIYSRKRGEETRSKSI